MCKTKVQELNAEMNAFYKLQKQPIIFVGVTYYLYYLKQLTANVFHLENEAFAKVHELLNEKRLQQDSKNRPLRGSVLFLL